MHTNYIIRDESPAPSGPSRIYPVVQDYETPLNVKDSFSDQGPRERVSFHIQWKSRIRSSAEGEASPLGGQLE